MKIDFNSKIYEMTGDVATAGGVACRACGHQKGIEELTLGKVASKALLLDGQGIPKDMPKHERALLALRIYDAKDQLDVKAEQVAAIKKYVEMLWPPLTVAQAFALLEGDANPFDPKNRK